MLNGKYKSWHPSFQPFIAFSQRYELKRWFKRVIADSLGKHLYFFDGKSGAICDSNNILSNRITSCRIATREELLYHPYFQDHRSGSEVYYSGVGGVCRKGLSYTSLKSNPYLSIEISDYFASNTYMYPLAEGLKEEAIKLPLVIISPGLAPLSLKKKYKSVRMLVLPSEDAWDALFEAVIDWLSSMISNYGGMLTFTYAIGYTLCPFKLVRDCMDLALNEVLSEEMGFMHYVYTCDDDALLKVGPQIIESALKKLSLFFRLVYGLSGSKVGTYNNKHLQVQTRYLQRAFSSFSYQNVAMVRTAEKESNVTT